MTEKIVIARQPSAAVPGQEDEPRNEPFAKRILVPVDPSDQAPETLRLGRDMARAFGADLRILAVLGPEDDSADKEKIRWRLWERYSSFVAAGGGSVDCLSAVEVRWGEPSREIVSVAVEMAADLIVMGTHGRRDWQGAAVGSVAERVIREAPCPVVALRTAGPSRAVWSGMAASAKAAG